MKNREIKFRGYDPYGKFDAVLNKNVGAWISPVNFYDHGYIGMVMFPTYSDRYTWQQFTGLKDKNGKEIYEGDIVKFKEPYYCHERDDSCDHEGGLWENVQIVWACNGFKLRLNKYRIAEDMRYDWIEVTGNIFDNLELVK